MSWELVHGLRLRAGGARHRTFGPTWGACAFPPRHQRVRRKDQSSTFSGRRSRRCGHNLGPLEGKARRSEESRGKVHIPVQRRGRPQCPGGAGCEQWGQSLESPDRDLTARRGPCESPGSALREGPHDCAQHVRRGCDRGVPRRTLFSSNFSQVNNEVYLLLAHTVSVYVVLLFQKTY